VAAVPTRTTSVTCLGGKTAAVYGHCVDDSWVVRHQSDVRGRQMWGRQVSPAWRPTVWGFFFRYLFLRPSIGVHRAAPRSNACMGMRPSGTWCDTNAVVCKLHLSSARPSHGVCSSMCQRFASSRRSSVMLIRCLPLHIHSRAQSRVNSSACVKIGAERNWSVALLLEYEERVHWCFHPVFTLYMHGGSV